MSKQIRIDELLDVARGLKDPDDYEFERQVFVDRAANVFEVAMEALETSVEERVGDLRVPTLWGEFDPSQQNAARA